MTITNDHVITVTNLSEDTEGRHRPVRVDCSCGDLSEEMEALLADVTASVHVDGATRPAVARAQDIAAALRRSTIPETQARAVAVALLFAADLADGINKAAARKHIVDNLLRAVRDEP